MVLRGGRHGSCHLESLFEAVAILGLFGMKKLKRWREPGNQQASRNVEANNVVALLSCCISSMDRGGHR